MTEVLVVTFISDDDLERLTARFTYMALKGMKAEAKGPIFPGTRLFRIKDESEPQYTFYEQWIGDMHRPRGQLLYLLYEGDDPIWRMVVDYTWFTADLVKADLDHQEAQAFLTKSLLESVKTRKLIHMPERQERWAGRDDVKPEGFFFRDSVDGTLRAFNGQRHLTTKRRLNGYMRSVELYLGEIQGGTF